MSYASVSRRVVKVKVKAKPGPGKPKPSSGRGHTAAHGAARAPDDEFFQRSPSRRRPVPPPPRWRLWSADTLVIALAVALVVTIYLLAQNSRNDQEQPIGALQASDAAPSMLQAAPAPLPPASIGRADDTKPAGLSPATDQNVQAALDDGRKLVLPTDVSGSCDIGERSIKDFSGCLTRNGARVE